MAAGERFAIDFKLGPVPAANLIGAMEREFGILVLMVDAIDGVSGAACRLPELDAVLINRHEVPGRRNFDLAHELFHILTWDAMPPEHVEDSGEQSRIRVEQLANKFASALLMPATVLEPYGPWSGEIVHRLNATANALQVTATAMKWRLVDLGWHTAAAAKQIPDAALRNNGQPPPLLSKMSRSGSVPPGRTARAPFDGSEQLPPLFSRPFMEVVALAIVDGQLSARRAADLLDMSLDELAALCATHGVEVPFDL
jgi:Zn-dependent peptidase ImmA (M78 family)